MSSQVWNVWYLLSYDLLIHPLYLSRIEFGTGPESSSGTKGFNLINTLNITRSQKLDLTLVVESFYLAGEWFYLAGHYFMRDHKWAGLFSLSSIWIFHSLLGCTTKVPQFKKFFLLFHPLTLKGAKKRLFWKSPSGELGVKGILSYTPGFTPGNSYVNIFNQPAGKA